MNEYDYSIKSDKDKLRYTLVPTELLTAVAEVRKYGVQKYGDTEAWRQVEPIRYKDALFRHLIIYLENENAIDKESGLPHLYHMACNIAFLCALKPKTVKEEE